ncbi:ABC transporter, permease protein [Marvinbryantia formatexigens DSM 14469]|uniref:ABC transporter, permease protein n=1 Tax=Marvinbryantia formatexigens DSM 14469 TaxID=478749 RepID=C6LL95_9FIRM|nr:carbohydrate ABC transporter permease [Marvinbryantia formatexigens]EET58606.1 ABC transporter, permease protein [Marvinbryantia formatexigens DSM 14469]UWO25506.1 carbohydrate ABC transporter permease [Marvinbryantia formatexigens DSM 14469]SDG92414.1 putative aldouronate transport system permease protein [Marvinbryantia formatexigens]
MENSKIKVSTGYRVFQVINTIIMILVVFVTLYPFIYLVAQSFSSDTAVAAGGVTFFPVGFTTATYKYLLSDSRFFRYYGNTIIYSVVGTLISVFGTALLAYPLSKSRLRLNKFFTPFVVFTMYFSGGLIPNYILVTQWLHLGNTIWAVVLPGAISTFNLLLMKSFFAGLPEELEEAASIDGMGVYGIFIKIILPLSKPILATMTLFYLVGLWNEWFGPFLYLDDDALKPISLWVRQLVEGANNVDIGSSGEASSVQATLKSATMVLTSLPIICVYPFVQKYFVQGMTMGAVKG